MPNGDVYIPDIRSARTRFFLFLFFFQHVGWKQDALCPPPPPLSALIDIEGYIWEEKNSVGDGKPKRK